MLPWKLLIWQILQFMELFNCMKNGTRQQSPGSMSVLPRALSRGSLQYSWCSNPAGLRLPDLGRCSESQAPSLWHRTFFRAYKQISVMLAFYFFGQLVGSPGFPGGTRVKKLPINKETWVWSLGWEDPLEEGMATLSSVLAWRIPMDRGAWQATVHRVPKSQTWLKWMNMPVHGISVPRTGIEPGVTAVKS